MLGGRRVLHNKCFVHIHLRRKYLITWFKQSWTECIQTKEPWLPWTCPNTRMPSTPIKGSTITPKSKLPNGNGIQLLWVSPPTATTLHSYKALASRASSFSPWVMTTHESNWSTLTRRYWDTNRIFNPQAIVGLRDSAARMVALIDCQPRCRCR